MSETSLTIPAGLPEALRAAQHVAILTGAGISKESGLPTFREAQTGLWARYQPEDLATPEAFDRDPRLVWDWYTWRRGLVSEAAPNAGHLALVEMERRAPQLTLITQKVDGLHRQAGNQRVIELHGNINRTKCSQEGIVVESWDETKDLPPLWCPVATGRGLVWRVTARGRAAGCSRGDLFVRFVLFSRTGRLITTGGAEAGRCGRRGEPHVDAADAARDLRCAGPGCPRSSTHSASNLARFVVSCHTPSFDFSDRNHIVA